MKFAELLIDIANWLAWIANRKQPGKTIQFTIPGEPRGKGRPRFRKQNGCNYVKPYTPEETANYENLIKVMYANTVGNAKLEGPLMVIIVAYFAIPQSKSKRVKEEMRSGEVLPTVKFDVDNITKVVLDALNKIAFDDDKQVTRLVVDKRYSDIPEVRVSITELRKSRKKVA